MMIGSVGLAQDSFGTLVSGLKQKSLGISMPKLFPSFVPDLRFPRSS